jgi:ribonuclease P protein component
VTAAGDRHTARNPLNPNHLRARHRIALAKDFQAAFNARLTKRRPPLTVFCRPNMLPEHRLGLSVGRRVGPAVARARVKRLIREAFRLERAGLPTYPHPSTHRDGGYDVVVSAHPGVSRWTLDAVRSALADAVRAAHLDHTRRAAKAGRPAPPHQAAPE